MHTSGGYETLDGLAGRIFHVYWKNRWIRGGTFEGKTHTALDGFLGSLMLILIRWQAFRPDEAVDIQALDNGGYTVGYIAIGEYLRFSVDVTEDGEIHKLPWRIPECIYHRT